MFFLEDEDGGFVGGWRLEGGKISDRRRLEICCGLM